MAEGGNTPVGGLEIEISTNATTAETAIKNLASAMEKLASVKFTNDGVAKIVGQLSSLNNVKISGTIATRLTEIGKSMDSVSNESINRLDRATAALQRLAGVDLGGSARAIRSALSVTSSDYPRVNAPSVDTGDIRDAAEEVEETSRTLRDIDSKKTKIQVDSKEAKKAEKDVDSLKGKVSALSKVLNAFKRIAFYRAIRAAIKAVTDAFREGLNNLYQYSKVAGTSFAPAMDSAATSALYLKNSLGSAAGALLESLIPAITILVDKLVDAVNWVNQLISALSGKDTWSKPIKVTKQYAQAANSAADAVKRWTMGIDELNIISKTSGAGGILSGPSVSDMFEQAPIDENIMNLADKLKELWPVIKTSLALLGGFWILKKIADLVGLLTGAFGRKNSALQTQNGLETAASKELATGLVPNLLLAAAGALGLSGALEKLKSPLGETVPAFEGVSAAASSMENATSESMDGAIDAVKGYATETETAMETVRNTTSDTETALNNSYFSIGDALRDLATGVSTNTESIRDQTANTQTATEAAAAGINSSYEKIREGIKNTADTVKVGSESIYNSSLVVGAGQIFLDAFSDALDLMGVKAETAGGLAQYWLGAVNEAANLLDPSGVKAFSDNLVTYFGNIAVAIGKVVSAFQTFQQAIGISTSSSATAVSPGGAGRQKMIDEAFQKLQETKNELANSFTQEKSNYIPGWVTNPVPEISYYAEPKWKDYPDPYNDRMENLNNLADSWFDFWESIWDFTKKNDDNIRRGILSGASVGLSGGFGFAPAFASGGFPTTGELFWARERGPELVGQIGNRTAVANNEQIVQGIAEGVEGANQGVINAIYGMANLIVNAIEQKDTDITLDGKRLVKYMAAESKRTGPSLVKVGV